MATAFLDLKGKLVGADSGEIDVSPSQLALSSATGQRTRLALTSGDTTVTLPTGTTAVLIVPPSSNTHALKIKGAADGASAGVLIHKTRWTMLSVDSSLTSFLINSAGTVTVEVTCL